MNHNINPTIKKTTPMYELEAARQQPIDVIVREALDCSPDRDSAAELLGVSRQTLWGWLKRLGMDDLIRNYYRNGKTSECVHHWIIEESIGPFSKGTCIKCGAEKEFSNYGEKRIVKGG